MGSPTGNGCLADVCSGDFISVFVMTELLEAERDRDNGTDFTFLALFAALLAVSCFCSVNSCQLFFPKVGLKPKSSSS